MNTPELTLPSVGTSSAGSNVFSTVNIVVSPLTAVKVTLSIVADVRPSGKGRTGATAMCSSDMTRL